MNRLIVDNGAQAMTDFQKWASKNCDIHSINGVNFVKYEMMQKAFAAGQLSNKDSVTEQKDLRAKRKLTMSKLRSTKTSDNV